MSKITADLPTLEARVREANSALARAEGMYGGGSVAMGDTVDMRRDALIAAAEALGAAKERSAIRDNVVLQGVWNGVWTNGERILDAIAARDKP